LIFLRYCRKNYYFFTVSLKKIDVIEPDMNRSISLLAMKIVVSKMTSASGILPGTAEEEFFYWSPIRHWGAPP
jgi:hypothetical protein